MRVAFRKATRGQSNKTRAKETAESKHSAEVGREKSWKSLLHIWKSSCRILLVESKLSLKESERRTVDTGLGCKCRPDIYKVAG